MICNRLDGIAECFVDECEKEYAYNPRYFDSQWIYEFVDGDDIINKIIDVSLEYFKERMYPLDEELCDMIFPKVREKLFEIGRDYFSVQFHNQSMLNFKCRIGRKRKNEQSDKILWR